MTRSKIYPRVCPLDNRLDLSDGNTVMNSVRSKPYLQAIDLQMLIVSKMKAPEATAKDVAACACAWDRLEHRKRILRGKPEPGSYRPEVPRPKRRQSDCSPVGPEAE